MVDLMPREIILWALAIIAAVVIIYLLAIGALPNLLEKGTALLTQAKP